MDDAFSFRHGELCAESVPLREIARHVGTPVFVYSRAALCAAYRRFDTAFAGADHLICYAVKANSTLAVLNLFARLGAGFDIVSGGELARVLAAGGNPHKTIFSGVGKSEAEIAAALNVGILCFNVESESELLRIDRIAGEQGTPAPVSLRVNPDVDPGTHPYISTGLKGNKFGVAYAEAERLYHLAHQLPHLRVVGVDYHIGSQITEAGPLLDALDRVLLLIDKLAAAGIPISHLDIGGGIGIRYQDEEPLEIADYVRQVLARLRARPLKVIMEPGRSLVGNAGLLLTRVEYLKHGEEKNFAIVDAAMNDLMRPALYDAYHEIVPVLPHEAPSTVYEVVGPVCESGDFLGRSRSLSIAEGDLLAILSAGAYASSMSSNYNTRPRAAEVIVDQDQWHLASERESVEQLFARERLLP